MTDRIVLNTPRHRGEYPLDFDDPVPSALEWHWVKKISGYTLATAGDGYNDSDPSFFIALACIALVRAGRIREDDVYTTADELKRLPFDGSTLSYVGAAEEAEPVPPAEAATTPPSQNTGESSNSTWGRSEPTPTPIGARG